MNMNSAGPRPQIRERSRPFRSLLVATAAAVILTGFIVPKADAVVVSYFNFEDSGAIGSGTVDLTPDKTVAAGGDNPGGGVEVSTTNLMVTGGFGEDVAVGVLTNRTAGDTDTANPGSGIGFRRTGGNPGMTISFSVNTQFYAGLSLSFAVNNAGNGYHNVTLSYSINGGPSVVVGTQAITTTTTLIAFTLPPAVDGNGNTFKFVTFTLTFTNGQSNGNNADESIFDNIRLDATTVVPEPATVWGGLLGVCALCWYQRRRLIGFLPLRRA
jgi:hypothetical protein